MGRELPPALGGALAHRLLARARAAWPDLAVPGEGFLSHLAEPLGEDAEADALETLPIEDLYLAFACGTGTPGAVEAFEREYGSELGVAVSRMRGGPAPDDARQLVHQKLFVSTGGARPKILEYGGRSGLRQ